MTTAGLGVLLAAVLGLTGCSTTPGPGPSPNPAVTSVPSTSDAPGAEPHNDADVAFASGMVPHHQQAVAMSDTLLAKTGVDGQTRSLAESIKAAQAPEITTMTGWLRAWGAPSPSGQGAMGSGGGMMSPGDMDALAAANGAAARRLFLTGMITHHQGAVAMAQTELAQGLNPDAEALARSVIASQSAEIATMQQLLGR